MADNKLIQHGFEAGYPGPLDIKSIVANVAALNAIPEASRFIGMQVFVIEEDVVVRLNNGITNGNWVPDTNAFGVFYNDDNTGLNENTVQAAIEKLYTIVISDSHYLGLFDPNTPPTPAPGDGGLFNIGDFYLVSVDGDWNFTLGDQTPDRGGDNFKVLKVGEQIFYQGSQWEVRPHVGGVISVNGDLGPNVVLNGDNIPYDNAASGLTATEIQGAIDELHVSVAGATSTIKFEYADITALLAAQITHNHTKGDVLLVKDATTDTAVATGYAYYEFIGPASNALTDYQLLSTEQGLAAPLAASAPVGATYYADMAALYAGQGTQKANYIYGVLDASGHTSIEAGLAHFVKLAASTGSESDYQLLGKEQDQHTPQSVLDHYDTLGDAIAKQGDQISGGLYYIKNFPGLPTDPSAYVEYLGTTTTTVNDYRVLSAPPVAATASLTVVEDITERDALTPGEGDQVFVKDATGATNPTITNTIWALYVYETTWKLVATEEDVVYKSVYPDGTLVTSAAGNLTAGLDVATLKQRSISSLLDQMLFATIQPTINTVKSLGVTGVAAAQKEVGTSETIVLISTFSRGLISNGDGSVGPALVGAPNLWKFYLPDLVVVTVTSINLVETYNFPLFKLIKGNNIWKGEVTHDAGTGVYNDSKGNPSTVLDPSRIAGTLIKSSSSIQGAYGFFYGFGIAPTNSAEVRAGTKVLLNQLDKGQFDFTLLDAETEIWFATIGSPAYEVTQNPDGLPVDITGIFANTVVNVDDAGGSSHAYQVSHGFYGAAGHGDLIIRVIIK